MTGLENSLAWYLLHRAATHLINVKTVPGPIDWGAFDFLREHKKQFVTGQPEFWMMSAILDWQDDHSIKTDEQDRIRNEARAGMCVEVEL